MNRAAALSCALALAGCTLYPEAVPLGQQRMPGYFVVSNDQPGFSTGFYGFLVGSDAPDHYSVAWVDTPGGQDVFSGTISVDGTIDQSATFAHTGQEGLTFDAPNQLSFRSTPGRTLHGIDVVSSSDVIYLDARINQSHVGVNVEFIALATNCGTVSWNTVTNPVAFTRDQRSTVQSARCSSSQP
ncbi:MAG TPA: hypothetical protein VFF06_36345 [Polyangia bacterium]|nr:hypothetical protein [Polyangia bacterium]